MEKGKTISCPFCGKLHDYSLQVCPLTGLNLRFADPQKAIGSVIGGKYRLEKMIGKGGMGTVYEATNLQIEKKVAIKTLLPESSKIDQIAERFKREARSAASIGHENIVDIYDLDKTEEGVIYIVMELLKGYDLAEILKSGKSLSLERTASIGVQTARALGAAHERGIIHRDLKPENIYLCQRKSGEIVKIVDFGIAMIKEHGSLSRLTTDGILLGTPYYMSPEQARGVKELDHRVDIYALGAVLFECLTGSVLFSGETYLEVISKHQIEPPQRPSERKKELVLPESVENLIMKMLEKDPSKRPSSMEEVEKILLPYSRLESGVQYSLDRKSEELAETIADSRVSIKQAEILKTTPVEWDTKKKLTRIFTGKKTVIAVSLIFAFISTIAIVLWISTTSGKNKSQYKVSNIPNIPIETISTKTKDEGKTITINIKAFPQDAEIILDGKPLEGNPFELNTAASQKIASLEVRAPGYKTYFEKVKLDKNQSLTIVLEPEKTKDNKQTKGKIKSIEEDKKTELQKKGKPQFEIIKEIPHE